MVVEAKSYKTQVVFVFFVVGIILGSVLVLAFDSGDIDYLCNINNSLLQRVNGIWGCQSVNVSIVGNVTASGFICDSNGCIGGGVSGSGNLTGSGLTNSIPIWLNSTHLYASDLMYEGYNTLAWSPVSVINAPAKFYIGERYGDEGGMIVWNNSKDFYIGDPTVDYGTIHFLNYTKKGVHIIKPITKEATLLLGNEDDFSSSYQFIMKNQQATLEGTSLSYDTNNYCLLPSTGGLYCSSASSADARIEDGYVSSCDGGCFGLPTGSDGQMLIEDKIIIGTGSGSGITNVINADDKIVINLARNDPQYISGTTADETEWTELCLNMEWEYSKYVYNRNDMKICMRTKNKNANEDRYVYMAFNGTEMYRFNENGSIQARSPDNTYWNCGVDNSGAWSCW